MWTLDPVIPHPEQQSGRLAFLKRLPLSAMESGFPLSCPADRKLGTQSVLSHLLCLSWWQLQPQLQLRATGNATRTPVVEGRVYSTLTKLLAFPDRLPRNDQCAKKPIKRVYPLKVLGCQVPQPLPRTLSADHSSHKARLRICEVACSAQSYRTPEGLGLSNQVRGTGLGPGSRDCRRQAWVARPSCLRKAVEICTRREGM